MTRRYLATVMVTMFFLCACKDKDGRTPIPEGYIIGFSTPLGNDIIVRRAVFDNSWSRPGGGVNCCWQETGVMSDGREYMPQEIYLEWIDESEQLLFTATVKLDPDTGKKALALPEYSYKMNFSKQKIFRGIYLIIGMREDGYVEVWLSNVSSESNAIGRVLETVGQAQATSKPWVPPNKKAAQ